MSSTNSIKNKLLLVATSKKYVNFSPEQLKKYHDEIEDFLKTSQYHISSTELFSIYEMQFYVSLMTGHDIEAEALLKTILDQFGSNKNSQRIKFLQSIYHEAMEENNKALAVLGTDSDEMKLSRRLTVHSRQKDEPEKYITNLNFYLNLQPTDLVTWAELGDEYAKIGHYDKAVFCFQEILLQEPHAYPVFYKVGLYTYYQFLQEYKALKTERKDKIVELMELLQEARDNFLMSIEICDVYIKSWVGIYLITTNPLTQKLSKISSVKEVSKYLKENSDLKTLSEKKIAELDSELQQKLGITV